MSNIDEITRLEEALRQAELGPDPGFFETYLADDAMLDGQPLKAKVVEAHRPGGPAKFTRVEMRDFAFVDHGTAVVVTCVGTYENAKGAFDLRFMRVWLRTPEGWRIVAGSTGAAS